jgi:ABC-type proline/glycine betaine transport system ATPase subunit
MDSDRVMVLDKGELMEFDTPRNLLENPKSIFASMVAATGPATAAYLRQVAFGEKSVLDSIGGELEHGNGSSKANGKTKSKKIVDGNSSARILVEKN